MSTLTEQFSAASKSQIQAQLDFIESFGARAFDGAARLIALNIDTSRAAVDSSSAALKQFASLRDPRDLLALARGPQDFSKMVAYGSEWLSIMADVQTGLLKAAAPSTLAPEPGQAPAAAAATAAESPEEPAHSVKPSTKSIIAVEPEASPEPVAEARPIARAASKVAGKPLDIKPAAAPLETDGAHILPQLKPVEASPPPTVFEQELLTPKRGKKR